MEESVLRLQNVSKYYYTDASVTQALRKINLEFHMGEFVAITGESGGGKSTLLNIISGMDSFDEGEMFFQGEPTFQYDEKDWEEYRRNRIGFVFQDYSLIGHYSARENIVAALLIQDMEESRAQEMANQYLKQVGLAGHEEQRASQLSSGQKQRLSIARALAKNTDIIVADEPTGNLDSETGEQIVRLLAELSREKLVIMVTHNYEQAAPYVTRKIRLHDGELVTDVPVTPKWKEHFRESGDSSDTYLDTGAENAVKKSAPQKDVTTGDSPQNGTEKKYVTDKKNSPQNGIEKKRGMAFYFARKNIQTQPGRAVLFFGFFLITAVTSFLFMGQLLMYADDRITKEYDSSAYLQQNDTRLVVRYPDNRPLTEEDCDKIRSVRYVEEVDQYDYCNDVNYYFWEGKGYEYFYGEQEETTQIKTNENGKEVESTVYSDVQGLKFLTKEQFMRSSSCLSQEDLSTGRLPERRNEVVVYAKDKKVLNTAQICYFTADNIWSPGATYQTEVTIVGLLKEKTDQVYFAPELCQMLTVGLDGYEYSMDYYYDALYEKYNGKMRFVPVIADDLTENEVRVSENYDLPSTGYGLLPDTLEMAFPDGATALIHLLTQDDSGEQKASVEQTDDGNTFDVVTVTPFSSQGADFVEMSEELFRQLYDQQSTQASVYISNYSRTKKVLKELGEMGFDALSTYQVSTTEYIPEKVYLRLEVIGISCLVLLALLILQILIVRSLMKIKIKDYFILKFMGMRIKQMNHISYLEMGMYCMGAVFLTLVLMAVLSLLRVPVVSTVMPYYSLLGLLAFIAYNVALMVLTVFFFNRLLRRKVA